ncbi:MAG: TPM domain-containing protein [Flavobacterium sp.]
MNKTYFIILLTILFANTTFAQVSPQLENKKGNLPEILYYVNDFEGILSWEEVPIIDEKLEAYFKQSEHKIILVTIPSIEPYEDIFNYSLDLAININTKQNKNAEIVIVISKNLRQIQIQNIDQIREKLTDEETKNIIENFFIPEFKNDKYFTGIINGIEQIKKELQ